MLRIASLLVVVVAGLVPLGSVARAQVEIQEASAAEPIERPPEAERPVALQLAEADAQAETGGIVLGVGITAHVLGFVSIGIGGFAALLSIFGGDTGPAAAVLLLSGAVLFFGGLVAIIVGASLQGGAASRRRRLGQAQLPPLVPFLAPLADGASVGLAGRF